MNETLALTRKPGIAQGWTIILAAFLPILAIVSLFPAVPSIIAHFSKEPGAMTKVPAMVSAPGLTIAIVALFAGFLVDRFGRRRLLIAAAAIYGVVGMAPLALNDLDAIYVSRLALGVPEAILLTALNTLIGDYWDGKERRNWLALQNMVGPFLASGAILLSGHLTGIFWNASFMIYGVGFLICLLSWAFIYEPRQDIGLPSTKLAAAEGASAFPIKGVVTYGVVTLLSSALYYVFIINGAIVWGEIGVTSSQEVAKLSAIPSLFIIAGAVLFWLTGRWGLGPYGQITMFLSFLGTGLVLVGFAQDWRWMTAGMIVQQTGAGMAIPVLIGWAQSFLPFEHRGRGMGVWTACFFLGQFTSPLLISLSRQTMGTMQGAFVVAGTIGIAGALAVGLFAGLGAKPRTSGAAA
ncbi:MAG: MFS transporter [Novosphingobium sp. 28-62-57]|uniref:MFS transporter n=1 Tax=unclassified Novosphingobium TaxID=2644732 RepID=UPI000BC40601|nr:MULTISPECIES: MFS transporter [unclassified Novosphingobium]OYW50401.1 MAG: MFS transporter [Novosphingobium sp. 12-62-10]OYZ11494.1 MAG: MFS transporter [Novosphingobium sp. 28-62-57]OZA36221.1 MAG: MFS transporter [Novosphingobium sp. 17-62-9]HQS68588.1 MFS transporter [Novosphingobium sp.]